MALQLHLQPTTPHSLSHPSNSSTRTRRPRTAPTLSTISDGVPLSTPPRPLPLSLPRVSGPPTPPTPPTTTTMTKSGKGVFSQLATRFRRNRTKSGPVRTDVEMAAAQAGGRTAVAPVVPAQRTNRGGRNARQSSVRTVPVYSEEMKEDEILLAKTDSRLSSSSSSSSDSPPSAVAISPPSSPSQRTRDRTSISSISSLRRVPEHGHAHQESSAVGEDEREGLLRGEEGGEPEGGVEGERRRPVIRVQAGTLDSVTSPTSAAASPLSPPPIYHSPIESTAPVTLSADVHVNENEPRQRRTPPSSFLTRVGNRLRPSSSSGPGASFGAPPTAPESTSTSTTTTTSGPQRPSFGTAASAPVLSSTAAPAPSPSPGSAFRNLIPLPLPGRRSRTNSNVSQSSASRRGEIGSPLPESLLRGSYGFANPSGQTINSRRTSMNAPAAEVEARGRGDGEQARRASNASEVTLADPASASGPDAEESGGKSRPSGEGPRITESQMRYMTEQGRLNMLAVSDGSRSFHIPLPPPPTFDQATIASMPVPDRERRRRNRRPHTAGAGPAPSLAPSRSGRPGTAGSIMSFGARSSRSQGGSRPGSSAGRRTQTSMAEGLSPTEADAARTQYILFSPF